MDTTQEDRPGAAAVIPTSIEDNADRSASPATVTDITSTSDFKEFLKKYDEDRELARKERELAQQEREIARKEREENRKLHETTQNNLAEIQGQLMRGISALTDSP